MLKVCTSRKQETACPRGENERRWMKVQEGERKSSKVEAVGIKGSLNGASSVSHSHLVARRILFLKTRFRSTPSSAGRPEYLILRASSRGREATRGEFRGPQSPEVVHRF